jgi:hypothetical protein
MKMLLKIIFGLLLILAISISYYVMYRVGPRVETAIETILPEALGTEVTIKRMSVLPLHGSIQLYGVTIANPEKFREPYIAEAQKIKIVLSLRSLLTDVLVVKEIEIIAPIFNYEKRYRHDNFGVISQNVKDYLAKNKDLKTEKESAADKPARKVIIERFALTGGKVNAKITGLPTAPIILPDIELKDIGKDSGGTTWGVAGRAMGHSISEAVRNIIGSVKGMTVVALKGSGNAVRDTSGEVVGHVTNAGEIVLDGATNTGGKVLDTAGGATDAVRNTATHVLKSIEGLFTQDEE